MTINDDTLDLREKGTLNGSPIYSDTRLYSQFLAFGNCLDTEAIITAVTRLTADNVVYADLNDPCGIGLCVMHTDPEFFVTELRGLLGSDLFASLERKAEYTMFGRSYSIGYESDLKEALVDRPISRALNPENRWAVWYPVRRAKAFEALDKDERRAILMEHAGFGRRFAEAGLAQDIRYSSHGLNKNDNDFIIGLVGSELHVLSALVQAMRRTKQTSAYLENMGPFFVGRVLQQWGVSVSN